MPRYSIVYVTEDAGRCPSCDDCEEIGRGPIGMYGEVAICDWCLLMGHQDLGALLVMAHIAREIDRLRGLTHDRDQGTEVLSVFSAWSRYYAQDADRKWPPRVLRMVDRLVYRLHPLKPPS